VIFPKLFELISAADLGLLDNVVACTVSQLSSRTKDKISRKIKLNEKHCNIFVIYSPIFIICAARSISALIYFALIEFIDAGMSELNCSGTTIIFFRCSL
jgi:hypothetical protein